ELEQLVLKGRKFEKKVLFGDGLSGPAAIGTGIAGLGVVDVEVVGNAVLAGVRTFVYIAVLAASLEQVLNHARVLRAGGALEMVDLEAQQLPLSLEFAGDGVAELLGRLAGALGGA